MSDITLAQVEAIMPNIPTPPKGCEWEVHGWGRSQANPLHGRVTTAYASSWSKLGDNFTGLWKNNFYLVAKPTHRDDGTPLSIPPLPEIEGYRFEYRGKGWEMYDCMYTCIMEGDAKWDFWKQAHDTAHGVTGVHYAEAFPIAKPTTLEGLFPDGESQCWVRSLKHPPRLITEFRCDGSLFLGEDEWSIEAFAEDCRRYSNHPLTKWADAKPFIGGKQS